MRWVLITTALMGLWVLLSTQGTDPTINEIDSQAGLYFDEMGQILFYTAHWKMISYANLRPVQLQWKQVKEHPAKIVETCAKMKNETWYHLTDGHAFASYISKVKYTDQLRDIIADYSSP
jgi:hypothetical protein